MSESRIAQLAHIIASQTAVVDNFLRSEGLPQPSFEPDGPVQLIPQSAPEIEKAKNSIVEATIELRQLLEGPFKSLLPESNFAPLAAVHRFNIASAVPPDSPISYSELAEKCYLREHDLQRIVRFTAVHHRVLQEPSKGFVGHTLASKLLSENDKIRDLMSLTFDECWPAHTKVPDAIANRSEEPNASGYAQANNTSLTTFEFLEKNPLRAQRFAGAMSSTSLASLNALCNYFDWKSLPENSTVVDVGGSQGHVSFHLAEKFPHLRFVVQDLARVVEKAHQKIPANLKGRVKFMAHDMFTRQPVRDADVYLFRYVFHDWPDKYCLKILRMLRSALKKGARVVIQDHILREPGEASLLEEMQIRSMDAIMLSLFNSRERGEDDWKKLVADADPNFTHFTATRIKENPSTGVIVAEWESTASAGYTGFT